MIGRAETGFVKKPARTDQELVPQIELAIQRDGLLATKLKIKFEMILQVLTDAGQLVSNIDASIFQDPSRPDTGQLQQMRRGNRPGAEYQITICTNAQQFAVFNEFDRRCPFAVEQNTLRQCSTDQL